MDFFTCSANNTQCLQNFDTDYIPIYIYITFAGVYLLLSTLLCQKRSKSNKNSDNFEIPKCNHTNSIPLYYTSTKKGAELFSKFETDAGFDFVLPFNVVIPPHGSVLLNTYISIKIPYLHVGILHLRSSSFRSLNIQNGIIDHGYNGRIYAFLRNNSRKSITLLKNNRYFQIIILPIPNLKLRKVKKLHHEKNSRNCHNFGSTGGNSITQTH